MRKYYWYVSIFFRKHGAVILASIIAAIFVFSVLLPFAIRQLEIKRQRYIAVVGRYTLDALPRSIQEEVSQGLTQKIEDGSVIPNLSERWSIEDEGKTYRFLLKQNLVWQDGKPFTAEDVNYRFNNVQILTTANEVIFKLNEPFAPFPSVVTQPIFRTIKRKKFFFFNQTQLLGTGAYQVTSYKENESRERLEEIVVDSPTERKIYRFYLTEADAIQGFERGEVNELPDLSGPGEIEKWPTVNVIKSVDQSTYVAIFFNTNQEQFKNKEIVQALNYALHKPTDQTRALGPISPNSWAYAEVAKSYDYDLARAIERILSVNALPREPLSFELTTTPNFFSEAENIKKEWETFGQQASQSCLKNNEIKDKAMCENVKLRVDIRVSNFPDTSNFQAMLVGQESAGDPDQYQLWHSGQPTNFTGYRNTRIDSLLEKGRQTDDQKKRFEIYQDFQQFFSEDAPVIFLYYLPKYTISRK